MVTCVVRSSRDADQHGTERHTQRPSPGASPMLLFSLLLTHTYTHTYEYSRAHCLLATIINMLTPSDRRSAATAPHPQLLAGLHWELSAAGPTLTRGHESLPLGDACPSHRDASGRALRSLNQRIFEVARYTTHRQHEWSLGVTQNKNECLILFS